MLNLSKLQAAISLVGLSTILGLATQSAQAVGSDGKTDAPSLRACAFELYLNGDFDNSLKYYEKAVESAAKEYGTESSYIGQLYYEAGALSLDLKRTHHAETYLQKAVQRSPNSVMARVRLAECYQLEGKQVEALQQIQAALAKHSNAPEAREALVNWLQANKRTASAIHESYNLSVATRGTIAPPPKPVQVDQSMLAAAAPAPVVIPASSPLARFPWMEKKKEEVKPEAKPEALKPSDKKAEEKPDTTKTDKKADKKADKKPAKAADKPKENKPSKPKEKVTKKTKSKESRPQPQIAEEELSAKNAALKTTAKTIKPKKDEGEAETPQVSKAPPVQFAPMNPMASIMPSKPVKGRPQSMVPPPPPTTPIMPFPSFGGYQPPPSPMPRPPAPKVVKKPKPLAPPKEAASESPKSAPAASAGGDPEDSNFLLEWGDAHPKKKGK